MASSSYTEFCCRNGGSALNAGTRTGNSTEPGTAADLTYASGTFVRATGVFTVASGDPVADGVAVGDYVSVYTNAQTIFGLVGRVSARTTTTITVDTTAIHGATTNVSETAAGSTLRVGGAWDTLFPSGFAGRLTGGAVNSSGDECRINLKNDATPTQTQNWSNYGASNAGITLEGYTTSYGDAGVFTWDGGTNAVNVSTNAARCTLRNMIVMSSATTGTNSGVTCSSTGFLCENVCAKGWRQSGFNVTSTARFVSCEATGNNTSSTAGQGGFLATNRVDYSHCTSHDNTGPGFRFAMTGNTLGIALVNCIADSNTGAGFEDAMSGATHAISMLGCDAYNNSGDGFAFDGSNVLELLMVNCNAVKNGGWGLQSTYTADNLRAVLKNLGFGAGTQANTSGTVDYVSGSIVRESGFVTYANDATPWTDPANGDFRISLAAAKGAGYGTFFEQSSSYGGTVGYPDIGAAQHVDSGGGGIDGYVIGG